MADRFQKNPQTDADVNLLMKVFPDILPDGRVITHQQLEATLKMNRLSSHYRTVVNKWRKVLQSEKCLYLDGIAGQGQGYLSLTPDEMVRFGNRSVRSAGRKLRRAIQVISLPDDKQLSTETLKYRGLLTAALEKVASDHKSALRDVTRALAPVKQLPRKIAS